jgi:putative membrane protein
MNPLASLNWNPQWRREGKEPDYRFALANERTFLSWIRTALALLAAALLVDEFTTSRAASFRVGLVLTLVVFSATLAGLAYLRWRANEIAMRHSRPLPAPTTVPALAILVALACLLLLLFTAIQR